MSTWQDARHNLPAYHQTVCIETVSGEIHNFCFYRPYMWHGHDHKAMFTRDQVVRWRHHTAEEKYQRNVDRFKED